MAISKVSQYNSSPTTVADYQAQNNYLQALINQANGSVGILTQADVSTIPSISQGSYISMGGTLYIVDTENYTILGSVVSGNNYIAIAVSGENLIATWTQDISSYSWNSVYNYYSDGTNILLPYIISYDTSYYIGTFQQSFKANQSLLTTDDVSFKSIGINGTKFILTPTSEFKSTFSAPASNARNLTFDGTNLISCDSVTDLIYVHDGISSTILSSFSAPSDITTGLTFDGTNLISCDSTTDLIYIHDGISSTILSSFASPSSSPQGLAFDGTNLISHDGNTDLIYIHEGISSTILSSFSFSAGITGLTFDGTNLISCSTSPSEIYIHDGISSTIKTTLTNSTTATGVTFNSPSLISCKASNIYIHKSSITI